MISCLVIHAEAVNGNLSIILRVNVDDILKEAVVNLNSIMFALGIGVCSCGVSYAEPITKVIHLVAYISDNIYVSKPDGVSWYGEEELIATDRSQKAFANTFPIRVWTSLAHFNIALGQPLKMSNGSYELRDVKVVVADKGRERELTSRFMPVVQSVMGEGGYDQIHYLKVSAKAPERRPDAANINGSYRGDLVVMFESKNDAP